MGRSEELGTGLRNVFKYSKAYSGSSKVSFLEEDIFVVKVPLGINEQINNVGDNVGDNRLMKVMDLIKRNNQISAKQIAIQLSVTDRTIERDIEKLKKQGKLLRIGNEKSGHWEVKVRK